MNQGFNNLLLHSFSDLVIKDKEDFAGLQVVDIYNAVVSDVKYFLTDRGIVNVLIFLVNLSQIVFF